VSRAPRPAPRAPPASARSPDGLATTRRARGAHRCVRVLSHSSN